MKRLTAGKADKALPFAFVVPVARREHEWRPPYHL